MKKGIPKPRGFHGMLYGVPGVGKTTLLSQMPPPVAILDLDGGTGWLYHNLDGVTVYTLEPDEDPAQEIERFLLDAVRGRGEAKEFRSIGIDSLSSLRSRHLQSLSGDSLFYEIGDYGVATNWLRRVLTFTQYAPQMIMWSTHMKEEKDGPRLVIRPAGMSQNALNHCQELLDAIIFMGKQTGRGGSTQRFLTTEELDPIQGRTGIMAKDRTGFLPGVLELDEMDEEGNPPDMFSEYFGEIVKELGYNKPLKKKKKPVPKKKPTKKK
jgi:hypothetical protein